jgi:protein TonB
VLAAKPTTPEPVVNEVRQVPPAPLPPIQTPPVPPVNAPVVAAAVPLPAAVPTPPRYDADYLDNPKPVYPPLSRREREQGVVRLRVHVEANGLPSKIEVQSSSGFERLDKAAVTAVGRWRFVPAHRGNEAVADWVTFPVNFSLKE